MRDALLWFLCGAVALAIEWLMYLHGRHAEPETMRAMPPSVVLLMSGFVISLGPIALSLLFLLTALNVGRNLYLRWRNSTRPYSGLGKPPS